jgi:peptidoglycan/xylan/chitin deacetylase (PgdA/CDA1 family)
MTLYSAIRNNLSIKTQGRISKFLIYSGIKPTYNTAKSLFEKGSVIFSADFEMAWAFRFSKTLGLKAVETGLKERQNVPELLGLFDKYQIPVTWATVGHLFLNECKRGDQGLVHSEMPRPSYFKNRNWIFNSGDWYQHDPCTDVITDAAWYAPDLISKILLSGSNHEIGCHTFSHIDFTYSKCSKRLADAELDSCLELAKLKGISLKSMVFPGGTSGNYESLKEKGFICYRIPMKHHLDLPFIDKYNLVAIPSSLGLDKDPYGWSKEFHLRIIKKFLDKTMKHKLVCHLWFHPSMDTWYLENVMPDVVKMVAEYRDTLRIEVKTMQQIAKEVLKLRDKTTQMKGYK